MIFAEGNIKSNEIKRTLAKAENEINPRVKPQNYEEIDTNQLNFDIKMTSSRVS